ncbi:MAG: tRNA (adenosine(37)-N6)-threonylcarbamoyltransferase complex transferase subunit TsaD, partial [Candidatus Magasanikbacteria bacterium]|nr:tRNA (adenosine(37)-N6)-threonylcarbamoyltransferase complex transferase subunit TsaD [Candidatus Magasanikbacteria bacterium]
QGNPQAVTFPRPMMDSPDFDFSFSGLKTAVLYHHQKNLNSPEDICASFQQAALDVLITKTIKAAKKYKVKTILTGGGVAANQSLQKQLKNAIQKEIPTILRLPFVPKFCGDNAVTGKK